jgi:AAA+ ATPase superfamily predicted ATPase
MEELQSPFLFGRTVVSEEFVNRRNDIEHLWLNVRSSINTVLISPRRWGKSSLVKHVAQLKSPDKQVKWCFIDMFAVRNEEEFYEKLSREVIKTTAAKWEEWIESVKIFFKQLVPKISFGIDPIHDFSLSFEWEELKKHKDEILNLPEIVAKKQNVRLVVCIDEFQNVHNFKEAEEFEKLLRSVWQHHENVSYCLYGSKRHLMSDIFNKKNRAFYLFGDVMLLDKIAIEHWVPFIVESFRKTGKNMNVLKNMKKLQYLDIVEKTKNKAIFLDPAFELWFKMYYLKS